MLQQYLEPEVLPTTQWSLESINSQIEMADARLERFEQLCASMEEIEQIAGDLEALVQAGDANRTTAVMIRERIQRVEEATGLVAQIPSMEDHCDDMVAYHQVSMEAVSGLWNRIKQVYVSDFQSFWDGMSTLFTGYRRWGLRQQARIHKLRQEWNDKKPQLNNQRHKGSLAGQAIFAAFTVEGRMSKDPVGDLAKDYQATKYLSMQYPKDLAVYVEQVRSIIGNGKFDSDEGFQRTVLGKLGSLKHPSTVLNSPLIGKGNMLLHNRGLEIKHGRSVRPVAAEPEYKRLADLSVQTYVKEFVFTWSMLNSGIIEDFYLTTAEVDKLLDLTEAYNKCLVNAMETFRPLQKAMTGLAAFAKKNIETENLNSTNQKAFRQMLGFVRGLTRYAKTPYRVEIGRVQGVAVAARIIASRTIATAE